MEACSNCLTLTSSLAEARKEIERLNLRATMAEQDADLMEGQRDDWRTSNAALQARLDRAVEALKYWQTWVPELVDDSKEDPTASGIYKQLRKQKKLLGSLSPAPSAKEKP